MSSTTRCPASQTQHFVLGRDAPAGEAANPDRCMANTGCCAGGTKWARRAASRSLAPNGTMRVSLSGNRPEVV
jgi:hypothetical protein